MRTQSEQKQIDLFERIATDYSVHYNDKYSTTYRNKFILQPLLKKIKLEDKTILDAMCGSGQVTEFLLKRCRRCVLHALDSSQQQIEIYRKRFPNCHVKMTSILYTGYPDNYFDIVVIVGGLHHVHPYVKDTIREIYRILKPEGDFLFVEPHSQTFVNIFRNMWYKNDTYFMDNEAAINFHRLTTAFESQFIMHSESYGGYLAYYPIYNSLIFRIPMFVKSLIAPLFLFLETLLFPLQIKSFSAYAIAQWKKK